MWHLRLAALWTAGLVLTACAGRGGPTSVGTGRVDAEVARRAGIADSGPAPDGADTPSGAWALPAQPLTEAGAVKAALLHNGDVRASYEGLGIARADLLQAGLLSNPVFTLEVRALRGGPALELGLLRSFVDLFQRPLRQRVARADLCAAEAVVARDLVRLVYDVRRACVRVAAADAVLALEEDTLRRAFAARDLTRRLHSAGNASPATLTLEELAAVAAELEVEAARVRAEEAREPLRVLLGLCGAPAPVRLADRLEAPAPAAGPLADVLARAQHASLDLEASRARIEAALGRAGRTRREALLPRLEAGAVGGREAGDGAWSLGPALEVELALFDRGQARGLAAQAGLRRQAALHEQLQVQVQSAARLLHLRASALSERLRRLGEDDLPLRERLVRETLQLYNAMQVGAFDVLRVKQQELAARREHAQALREAWLAALDLGELLAGSLNPVRVQAPALPVRAPAPAAPGGS